MKVNIPLDRDFTPYAYPAVFGTRYLESGHVDIKPPLIHWSYKLWMLAVSPLKSLSLVAKLRMLPLLGMSLACLFTAISGHTTATVILALLFFSPTIWPHMANTEWLTALLISMCLVLPPWAQFIALGSLPWVNQKNALIVVPVAWALHLPISYGAIFILIPSLVILSYLTITNRLLPFIHWAWLVPSTFGARRTFKANTLSAAKILLPCITLFAPFVAVMELDRWALVALAVFAVMLWSKQIVPHHFILLALPVAMSAHPHSLTWLGFALVWSLRDGIVWYRPALIYPVTFPNYDALLGDAAKIEAWIREHTKDDETIWVNGMENQIYLNTMRKAWRVEIPELRGCPEGEAPRVIVHCHTSHKKFDYDGYEPVIVSTIGLYTLMVRG